MSPWLWWLVLAAAALAWLRLALLCRCWSLEREVEPACFIACLIGWPIGLLVLHDAKPIPKLSAAERSLQMERDTGLRFDGIFLLPGYHDDVEAR